MKFHASKYISDMKNVLPSFGGGLQIVEPIGKPLKLLSKTPVQTRELAQIYNYLAFI